jgi:hypothetical protein
VNEFDNNTAKKSLNMLFAAILSAGILTACDSQDQDSPAQATDLDIDMEIPPSLTGGTAAQQVTRSARTPGQALQMAKAGTGQPCAYIGPEDDDDPFRNGYETSKFMISVMASWTCIADLLIDVAGFVPHNGEIIETENDSNADDFEADEPTHYSVTDESDTQVTIRMYYNYSRSQPPVVGEKSQFYISWNLEADGAVQGRMIVDGEAIDWDNHDPEDPSDMRMDFDFTSEQKTADMFLRFSDANPWADGFRIQITRELDSNPLLKVFEARGLISMKAQFSPVESVPEIPDIQLYTVSDALGNGASIAEFQDVALALILNPGTANHLGDYLFSKKDVYFFEYDMDWEYIDKTVISSAYRGNRTTPATGGTWLPFDPSIDMIVDALDLDADYFTASKCASLEDDCNDLLNATFEFVGGFAGQEQDQGEDPSDWRSVAIDSAEYLSTIYPNGVDWTDAFEHTFTPGL